MDNIVLTASAATVVAGLGPTLKPLVAKFLRQDVLKYVETHDPVRIGALQGDYWVVRPKDDPDQPIFVITRLPGTQAESEKLVVVSAVVPGESAEGIDVSKSDPVDIAVGVEVLRSVEPAS